jgi:branched-chain amino acid aminotransferase
MEKFISLNGNFFSNQQPQLDFSNRCFRYGDGFFETIRISHGKILWPFRHYQRLINSAKLLSVELPETFSFGHFQESILQLYQRNHPGSTAARIRLSVFRNSGGYYRPADNRGSVLIESEQINNQLFELNKKGLMVEVFPDLRKNQDYLAGIKSCSALLYVMAGNFCNQHKWGDCIILNNEGNVAETSSSNIFIIKNGELFTPALDQGCLQGIMRSVILDIASEMKFKAHEVILSPEDLEDADEFLLQIP